MKSSDSREEFQRSYFCQFQRSYFCHNINGPFLGYGVSLFGVWQKTSRPSPKDYFMNVSVRCKPPNNIESSIDSSCFDNLAEFPLLSPDQESIYKSLALPILDQLQRNLNQSATLAVYGQTGSGKTHTIFGPHDSLSVARLQQTSPTIPQEWGLFPRITIALLDQYKGTTIHASAIELYQETAYDLLNNRAPLQLKSSDSQRVFAKGEKPSGIREDAVFGGFHPPNCTCHGNANTF